MRTGCGPGWTNRTYCRFTTTHIKAAATTRKSAIVRKQPSGPFPNGPRVRPRLVGYRDGGPGRPGGTLVPGGIQPGQFAELGGGWCGGSRRRGASGSGPMAARYRRDHPARPGFPHHHPRGPSEQDRRLGEGPRTPRANRRPLRYPRPFALITYTHHPVAYSHHTAGRSPSSERMCSGASHSFGNSRSWAGPAASSDEKCSPPSRSVGGTGCIHIGRSLAQRTAWRGGRSGRCRTTAGHWTRAGG
jgi:hypothetical protein